MTTADTMRAAVEALEAARSWHNGDGWRKSTANTEREAWEAHRDVLDSALSLLRSALEGGEPKLTVLNALEVLERMDYRPGDSALVENFLAVLWARGMWVIESPLASIPPNTPVEAGKVGVANGVMASDGSKPE